MKVCKFGKDWLVCVPTCHIPWRQEQHPGAVFFVEPNWCNSLGCCITGDPNLELACNLVKFFGAELENSAPHVWFRFDGPASLKGQTVSSSKQLSISISTAVASSAHDWLFARIVPQWTQTSWLAYPVARDFVEIIFDDSTPPTPTQAANRPQCTFTSPISKTFFQRKFLYNFEGQSRPELWRWKESKWKDINESKWMG